MSKQSIEFVTVEHTNGEVYIGTIVPIDSQTVKVETGQRGRPIIIDLDDIEEILPVGKNNPHVEH